MRRIRFLAAMVLLLAGPRHVRAAVTPEWAARWRADLAFVADTLPKVHARLFHTLPAETFRAELDSLSGRVPHLDHHEITVELARIVARIGDGHTRLTLPFDSTAGFFSGHSTTAPPLVPDLVFRHLPVRFHLFADGLFVVRTSPEHRELLGGRVLTLGRLPIADAMAAVEPTVQRDNDSQVRDLLPRWLVVPEILHARGVSDDKTQVRLVVRAADGARREVTLTPVPLGKAPQWIEARDPGEPPLAERRPHSSHWFERLSGGHAVYARYREVLDDESETVAAFAESLFHVLRAGGANALILDLRGNVGGNGFLNRPLLHGIIATPALQRPGRLFVLADRGTFSAAVMMLADLETHTPAVIVGEKSGGAPNGYGDSRRVRLPNTGLTIRASTLYWQTTDPRDPRDGITPHVAIEERFADWKARRDPALDSTRTLLRDAGDPTGEWTGIVGIEYQRIPLAISVALENGGWSVILDAPELGMERVRATGVRFANAELAFARRDESPAWEFRARVAPGAIVGAVRFQGSDLPFVLGRKPR